MRRLKRRTADEYRVELAKRIFRFRSRAGLSKSQLSRDIDKHRSSATRWEDADDSEGRPGGFTVSEIAWACGVTMSEFWGPMPPTKKGRG